MSRVFFIAEAGVNHNRDLGTALRLIEAAAMAGADAVKFQTYDAERLEPPGSRRDMLAALQLPRKWYADLRSRAEACRIEFMSTPFDVEDLKFLVDEVGVKRIKIASGNLDNWPLLDAAKATELPLYLSTGGATLEQVELAEMRLVENMSDAHKLTLMHCVSAYPCPIEQANLDAITSLAGITFAHVGYSDHTIGPEAMIMAVALGATAIEKHFTLDRNAPGPDHRMSMDAAFLQLLIDTLRDCEKVLGDGIKRPMPCEAAALEVFAGRKAWREREP